MFRVNDTVNYSTTGVCKIVDIKTESFTGEESRYYVLKPVHQEGSTVYVPTENETLVAKMHKILCRKDVNDLIDQMPTCQLDWIEDEKNRQEAYKKIVAGGDRKDLIGLIRTMYFKQQELTAAGKKLHAADERIMKEAEKLLYDEFSVVFDVRPEEVLPLIMKRPEKSR